MDKVGGRGRSPSEQKGLIQELQRVSEVYKANSRSEGGAKRRSQARSKF